MVIINGEYIQNCTECPHYYPLICYFYLPVKEKGYGYPQGYNGGCRQVYSECPFDETIQRLKFLLDRQKRIREEITELENRKDEIYSEMIRFSERSREWHYYKSELEWIFKRTLILQQENRFINDDLIWLGNEDEKPDKTVWII